METNIPSDSAAALTPLLFLGHYLSLDHEKFVDTQHAVESIRDGKTILVSNTTDAFFVLVNLGVSISDALEKIRLATNVLPETEDLTL